MTTISLAGSREATLEHVNVTVSDPERSAALLAALFGWQVRWHGPSKHGGRTVHVGGRASYVALYSGAPKDPAPAAAAEQRLQHIAVEVDDLDAVEQRVIAAGYRPHNHGDYAPGRRFYFHDADGIEFEIVSYAGAAHETA